jgi:hypothetical protein
MGEGSEPSGGGWAGISLWRERFYPEYEVVRAAHELLQRDPDSVTIDELRHAADIAQKLLDAWPGSTPPAGLGAAGS